MNFDRDCIESVDLFWQDDLFYYINPANSWAWEIFPSSEIFNFFLQRLVVLIIQIFHLFRIIPRYFILFVTIEKGVVSLISFSACLSFVYRKAIDLFELILYPATSLKLFIRFRSSLMEFFRVTYIYYHIVCKKWYFHFFLSNLYPLDLLVLSNCSG